MAKLWCPALALATICVVSASIQNMNRLYETLFGNYSSKYRPVYNQSETVLVYLTFNLVAISELDLVRQILYSNVWMNITWRDDFLTWDPDEYDGIEAIHPPLTDIWRPKIGVPVSLEDRDLFKDDSSSITVYSNGRVSWYPGTNFITSCSIDVTLFPFDVQTCEFRFMAFSYLASEVKFISRIPRANLRSFLASGNGEWTIPSSTAFAEDRKFVDEVLPFFIVKVELKRRPGFYVLNVIIPVVVLSFLNILVFALPPDSGEKVSYGITCMLALIVFMSIVSGLLPKSSESLPLVTIYLTFLLGLTVLCVVASIFIVKCNSKTGSVNKTHSSSLVTRFLSYVFGWKNGGNEKQDKESLPRTDETRGAGTDVKVKCGEGDTGCRCSVTADTVCLFVFMHAWLLATIGFLLKIIT